MFKRAKPVKPAFPADTELGLKVSSISGQPLPLEDFEPCDLYGDGLFPAAISEASNYRARQETFPRSQGRLMDPETGTKVCSKCGEALPASNFYALAARRAYPVKSGLKVQGQTADGLTSACITCSYLKPKYGGG